MAKLMISEKKQLTKRDFEKWSLNLFRFTAPLIALFLGQLQMGVEFRAACLTLVYAFYGAVADLLTKWSSETTYDK